MLLRIITPMVFGWGKKKNEKQEVSSKEKHTTLVKIPEILDDIKEIRRNTLIAEINNFRERINPNLEQLLKIATELEKDNLKVDDVDKHLKVLVIRGKKLVISTIKNEANKKFGKIKSYEDAESLGNDVSYALKKMGDVLGRQSRVIHIFAKKYADKLKNILSLLNSDISEILRILQSYNQIDATSTEILNDLKKLDETKSHILEKEHRKQELSSNLTQTITMIDESSKSIEKLKSSSEYKEFLNIQSKITDFTNTQSHIKNEIDLQFTKISRPLGKYRYASSLDKETKTLLERLVQDPFDVLTSENKSAIIDIIQSVRKSVVSEVISVKDIQKSMAYLDETINMLDGYIKQIVEYNTQLSSLQKQLDVFDSKKLRDREFSFQKHTENKSDLESRINSLDSEISDLKESRPKILSQIQTTLNSISAIRYSITAE